MRHRKKRHLRGPAGRQRKELRALATALVLFEKIETTQARARLARSAVEKMITKGKTANLTTTRLLRRDLPVNAVKKITEVLSPKYKDRAGGYTRMIKVGTYRDGTKKVMLKFV